jgi:hypothetical protein
MAGVPRSPTYALAAWTFRRLLAIVYLVAFWSLARQILGLVGQDGIMPARLALEAAAARADSGLGRFLILPTLCWIGASDAWLKAFCAAGLALSGLLAVGVAPLLLVPALWLLYLSLTTIGGQFFAYQWDALLLEAGFLAIFTAPAVALDRLDDPVEPPRLGVWLFRWLLVRFVWASGAIKLTSGDPAWRDLTALAAHFETQPLPTPLAWHAHHLPIGFHKASAAAVLAIELAVPLLMIRRRLRIAAAALIVALQAAIALTGNYGFFGLLTTALCLFLLDDGVLGWALRIGRDARAGRGTPEAKEAPWSVRLAGAPGRAVVLAAVTVVTLPLSIVATARALELDLPAGERFRPIARRIAPFRVVNGYGPFAVIGTTRSEIVVEASNDGEVWAPYELRFKPGDPRRPLPWVAPHQPRLDWEMWFEALDQYRSDSWFERFLERLLAASPEVLRLVASAPFDGQPPRFVRAVLYQYRFAPSAVRRQQGLWWVRDRIGPYSPVLSLPDGSPP